jgi:RimJ/RimL family protein N-acetyltransferase
MRDIIFETDRLRARPWTTSESDVADAFAMYSDPEVSRFIRDAPEESLESQRALLERVIQRYRELGGGYGFWAVEEKASGRIVGASMVKPVPGHEHIEVGWHLARPAWGKGYATEAARGAIAYGFEKLGLERIVAVVHPDNARSLAVARRLGMAHTGRIHAYDQELELFVLERN